jgi:hypothetical protein
MKEKVYNFLPYKKAVAFVQGLHLRNQAEWQQYAAGRLKGKGRKPTNLPFSPYQYYTRTGEWVNWADWLGTKNRIHNQKEFPPYEKAREIVRGLGFTSRAEWEVFQKELLKGNEYSRLISRRPEIYYLHSGWRGWEDWLGIKDDRFLSYEQAKKAITKLGLKNWEDWRRFDKRNLPDKVPRNPNSVYKRRGTWVSWGDFLGVKIRPGIKKGWTRKKG